VYHVELRQFPHSLWRFNLTKEELDEVVEPWAREEWVDLGERKWSPHQARLTILEGPRIPIDQLSMGRGWRTAQRQSADVTERVLADAKALRTAALETLTQDPSHDVALLADSLGVELLSLLGEEPAPLLEAWRLAAARWPERPASECIALAEQAVRSLLRRRLIVLLQVAAGATDSGGDAEETDGEVPEDQVETVLRAVQSWVEQGESAGVRMRRS
jgi:hypothetical protein